MRSVLKYFKYLIFPRNAYDPSQSPNEKTVYSFGRSQYARKQRQESRSHWRQYKPQVKVGSSFTDRAVCPSGMHLKAVQPSRLLWPRWRLSCYLFPSGYRRLNQWVVLTERAVCISFCVAAFWHNHTKKIIIPPWSLPVYPISCMATAGLFCWTNTPEIPSVFWGTQPTSSHFVCSSIRSWSIRLPPIDNFARVSRTYPTGVGCIFDFVTYNAIISSYCRSIILWEFRHVSVWKVFPQENERTQRGQS